jgi:hypothetical protein
MRVLVADSTPLKLITLYKDMAELTLQECKTSCRAPLSCCSPEYCEFTIDFALRRGVTLTPTGHQRLPLMGPTGCVAPPHLRPMCTFHTCDVNSTGYKKNDLTGQWDRKYYDLRAEIEQGESELMDRK